MDKGKRKVIPSHRITRFFPRSTAGDNESGCDVEKVYEAMARFVCEDEHVTLPAIKMLVTGMNPSFPFSYGDLARSCYKVYLEERAKVVQIMENIDARIALSIDIVKLDTYGLRRPKDSDEQVLFDILCLRAHIIDDNWKPKSWVLYYGDVDRIMEIGYDKTILKRISDLRIESKISTVTRGYRDMIYEVIEVVEDQVKEKKTLQVKCQPFKLYCCANFLGKMVEAAFKDIEDIIWKILQQSFMYWHITFSRLQDAIKAEADGEFLEQFGSDYFDPPTEEEWAKLKYVCRLVDYIYNAAEVLFFTKNPTASIYLHNLCELQASLRKESISPDSSSIITDMLKQFDQYWNDMFLVLAIATVLDPRCKMKYIEFSSLKFEGNSGNTQATSVLEAIRGIYDDYKMHSFESQTSKPSDSKPSDTKPSGSKPSDTKTSGSKPSDTKPPGSKPSDTKPPGSKPSDTKPYEKLSDSDSEELPSDSEELPSDSEEIPSYTLERLQNCNFGFNCLDEYNEFLKPSYRPPKSELEWYFDEPVLPWSTDFDLMSWWRTESPKYPILSKMARDFLAIPFSVVSSFEAYYYRDFRPADTNLAFLGPDLPNALVCCRSYLRKD